MINIEQKRKRNDFYEKFEEYSKQRSKNRESVVTIDFSGKVVSLVLTVLAVLFWGKPLLTVILFFFLSLVIMSSVLPIIRWLTSKKIPKGLAVTLTYFAGVLFFLLTLSMIFVPFLGQFDKLMDSIPVWINSLGERIDSFGISNSFIDSATVNKMVVNWIDGLTLVDNFEGLASTVGGVFSWTSLIFAAIVFSIYLVLDHDNILDFGLLRITSDEKRKRVKKLVLDLEGKLGRWLLGQAIVSSIAGIVLGSTLALFGVPFALPMGVLIALLSTIPTLGATFGSIPPLLIALIVNGPLTAFIILLIFIVYQQIENNFIIPRVMGNAVGIRPILILLPLLHSSFFSEYGVPYYSSCNCNRENFL